MTYIFSRDEILSRYYEVKSIEEFFDSDVLILPSDEDYTYVSDYPINLPNIKTKICYTPTRISILHIGASIPEYFYLGTYIFNTVSFIASAIAVYDFIKRHYGRKKVQFDYYIVIEDNNCNDTITENNSYFYIKYKGKASDIDIENELKEIKEKLIAIEKLGYRGKTSDIDNDIEKELVKIKKNRMETEDSGFQEKASDIDDTVKVLRRKRIRL